MNEILIYTDGASRGNPGNGGWGAVVATPGAVFELAGREDMTTNNRMEMQAVVQALQRVGLELNGGSKDFFGVEKVIIHTDSSYLLNGITKWIHGWKRNGWKTKTEDDVVNRDLWEELEEAMDKIKFSEKADGKVAIEWVKVSGHAGVAGNERCDVLATSYADKDFIELFNGKRADYKIDLEKESSVSATSGKKKKSSKKFDGYYISFVNNKYSVFNTWAECETEVKGKKGAKFKKVRDENEEEELKKVWGVK